MNWDLIPNPIIKPMIHGRARVTLNERGDYKLFVDNNRWNIHNPKNHASTKEMYGSYELAYGDVLISGLGFGVLPTWLLSKNEINSITIIEKNREVIDIFNQFNRFPSKVKIIESDMNSFKTTRRFNCILLDHYEKESDDKQIQSMSMIYKNIPNHDVFYAWRIEYLYLNKMFNGDFFSLIENNLWKEFKNIIGIPTVPDLSDYQVKNFSCLCLIKKSYKEFQNLRREGASIEELLLH